MFTEALRNAEKRQDVDSATALLEAYVEFALQHTGHFRVMFRTDLTEMHENAELVQVADESFDVLVDHVEQVLGPRATVDGIRDRVVTMWSIAHGLATLLIEGPLEDKVGPIVDRRALIRAVASQSKLGADPAKPSSDS